MKDQRFFNDVFSVIDQYCKNANTPAMDVGLIDLARGDQFKTFGWNVGHPAEDDDSPLLFEIGSISKTFTAFAVMQAVEAGLLDIHRPVKEYLPWLEISTAFDPFTPYHLLTHSAGIIVAADDKPNAQAAVWSLRETKTGFAPGTHFYYSEVGYQLLTVLLETLQNKPFARILQEQILDPLGMSNTFPAITNQIRDRLAQGYQSKFDDRPVHSSHPLVPANWLETGSGDGCIVSTAADMAKFGRMFIQHGQGPKGRIISEKSYALITQEGVPGEEYGFGCFSFEEDGCRIIGHGGDMPGYEAMLILDETNQLGVIFLSTTPYPSGLSFGLQFEISRYRMGKPLSGFPALKKPLFVKSPEDYAGAYRMGDEEFRIEAGEDCLSLVFEDQVVLLESRGKDTFYANLPNFDCFLLRFGRNETGQVVEAFYGGDWYLHPRYEGVLKHDVPDAWHTYTGHYRTNSPWLNENNFRIVVRKGQLLQIKPHGDEAVLIPLEDGSFRLGEETFIPEVIRFDNFVEGKALKANISGWNYYRFFTA